MAAVKVATMGFLGILALLCLLRRGRKGLYVSARRQRRRSVHDRAGGGIYIRGHRHGHLNMNHEGQVLLEAASTGSGNTLYDYYRYDGTTCTDLLEKNAGVVGQPSMCDDGLMYYYY